MSSTPRLMRNSERGDFKRCPWMWHKRWILGMTTKRVPTWSWFGTAIHEGLRARYPVGVKRGNRTVMLEAFREALDGEKRRIYTQGLERDEDEAVAAERLGEKMLLGYVDHYGEDTEWEVIHTEQAFQVDVVDPDTGEVLVIFCGTWDALMRNRRTGRYWLWDHKTRKAFLKSWEYLALNDQAGSYLWVAPEWLEYQGIIEPGTAIEGIVFNYLRKALPDPRPQDSDGLYRNKPTKDDYLEALRAAKMNKPGWWPSKAPTLKDYEEAAAELGLTVLGAVSKVQPGPLYVREETFRSPSERVSMADRVMREARLMNWFLEDPDNRLFKTPTEDCVRCPLFDYCQLDEQNPLEGKEFADTMMTRGDFYKDHREAFAQSGVTVPGRGSK